MPLTSAIQSAMAIRHEREKRHQRRLSKIRRESGVGSYSSYFLGEIDKSPPSERKDFFLVGL